MNFQLGTIWETWWHIQLNILVAINSVVHNPGVSIIVFTLFIRLLTVPLTMKSLRSSRNMQQIQPLIKEIQKKYGKDKAKIQEETMKIYQQYGINPAAGCFPMLVQLPIFFGLYSALQYTLTHGTDVLAMSSVLYNNAWVPYANFAVRFLWVPNLAKPDPLYIWPLLSGILQFLQSRMAMPIRDPNNPADPQTKMMNNMMQFMPIYIVLISLGFPTGTVIYWAMSNLFGAVQQYFITGWGSMPNVPGFGFLPRKVLTPPPPPLLPADGTVQVKKGFMSRLMDKAVQAQEAQKATQASAQAGAVASSGSVTTAKPTATVRVKSKGKGSEPQVRSVQTDTLQYGSDLKYRGGATNGSDGHEEVGATPAQLPKKKRSKK